MPCGDSHLFTSPDLRGYECEVVLGTEQVVAIQSQAHGLGKQGQEQARVEYERHL